MFWGNLIVMYNRWWFIDRQELLCNEKLYTSKELLITMRTIQNIIYRNIRWMFFCVNESRMSCFGGIWLWCTIGDDFIDRLELICNEKLYTSKELLITRCMIQVLFYWNTRLNRMLRFRGNLIVTYNRWWFIDAQELICNEKLYTSKKL